MSEVEVIWGREGEEGGRNGGRAPGRAQHVQRPRARGSRAWMGELRGELGEKGLAGGGERRWPHHAGLNKPLLSGLDLILGQRGAHEGF